MIARALWAKYTSGIALIRKFSSYAKFFLGLGSLLFGYLSGRKNTVLIFPIISEMNLVWGSICALWAAIAVYVKPGMPTIFHLKMRCGYAQYISY